MAQFIKKVYSNCLHHLYFLFCFITVFNENYRNVLSIPFLIVLNFVCYFCIYWLNISLFLVFCLLLQHFYKKLILRGDNWHIFYYCDLLFQAYLREGVALQQLGQHGDALAAFAVGLAQDSSNTSLLSGLVDSSLKSPLKGKEISQNFLSF